MKLWKRIRIALAAVAILLAAQVLTWRLFGERAMPAAAVRDHLRGEALGFFDFVYVPSVTRHPLGSAQLAGLVDELKRHFPRVYLSEREMPPGCIHPKATTRESVLGYEQSMRCGPMAVREAEQLQRDRERATLSFWYRDGFALECNETRAGPFLARWRVGRRRSLLDVSDTRATYVWVLWRWVRV